MIRKYNYTGRQKISKERIIIKQDSSSEIKSFDIDIKISDLGFPDHAKIYIEPYFKSSFMRFNFGTIARVMKPSNTQLTDIPITDRVLYKLKVVDESNDKGLILGFAEELIAETSNNHGNKSALLPVNFIDLGNRIWKLEFENDGPILSVNCDGRIDKIREIVSKDAKFSSLVYPEAIRQIALNMATDDDFDFDEPGNSWQCKWLKFFNVTLQITHKPYSLELKDCMEWSDEISDAFCRTNKMINNLLGN